MYIHRQWGAEVKSPGVLILNPGSFLSLWISPEREKHFFSKLNLEVNCTGTCLESSITIPGEVSKIKMTKCEV